MWGYTSVGTELLLYEYLCYTDVHVSVSSFLACWSLVFVFLLRLLRLLLLFCCCCCCCCWSSCVVHCCQFLKMVVFFQLKMCCVLTSVLKQDPNTQRVKQNEWIRWYKTRQFFSASTLLKRQTTDDNYTLTNEEMEQIWLLRLRCWRRSYRIPKHIIVATFVQIACTYHPPQLNIHSLIIHTFTYYSNIFVD